mmetsp:Transcript_8813/g.19573  ORF Transcript_8813/g.19573 Transcript_8813/m.19573 type:complete len:536 (+) Transcript_8813:218-1825(+)|eukprot:CAMPEP_0206491954 /NCGR_PEP_ID=MMETSP0324_2-20121206/45573_1 /ASSEMBLY_ACC=CAM_ASM_000836 /TAXON_ID=2866 /ORGANISM="Crypthecodinium cohnii, Strain Seligo" /LENGTH=535 /DNA_ID=CAMNT_0053973783 /DNA_START=122 /DNA_END=1729 /DNA_ORIENTATION=+
MPMSCFLPNISSLGADSTNILKLRNVLSPKSDGDRKSLEPVAAAHAELLKDNRGCLDTRSEAGLAKCTKFLQLLTELCNRLGVEDADRSYRKTFSRNYRALFPDSKRRYRVDVLEASLERFDCFWVNGERYRLSDKVLLAGDKLAHMWHEIGCIMVCYRSGKKCRTSMLKETLEAFDDAWVSFEHCYIVELMGIETQARSLVLDVANFDEALTLVERSVGEGSPAAKQARSQLALKLARINSVANSRRKGRSDLSADVVELATSIAKDGEEGSVDKMIASALVDSFKALRRYFRHAKQHLDLIDPYLGNNPILVQRLSDYEESWENASRYLANSSCLDGLRSAVAQLKALAQTDPSFSTMCEDCDSEVFLVLPRLILLQYARDASEQSGLLSGLIPDYFGTSSQSAHSELEAFVQECRLLSLLLSECSEETNQEDASSLQRSRTPLIPPSLAASDSALFIPAALGKLAGLERRLAPLDRELASKVKSFQNSLEAWSMRLQRTCANDWNRLSGLMLKCLNAGLNTRLGPERYCVRM